ncbi:MAG: lytic transglycosylase domain-containing protein [Campylobacterales bacterium]|nr:lytic transglycosylase domain-containing protein [Campylobacterales bacterium]
MSRILISFLLFIQFSYAEKNIEDIYIEVGEEFNIPPILLWAITKVESDFNKNMIYINKNGTIDIGLMQINSVHWDTLYNEFGVTPNDLFDIEINIRCGAWELSNCIDRYEYSWDAITCFNGFSTDNKLNKTYAKKISKALDEAKHKIHQQSQSGEMHARRN